MSVEPHLCERRTSPFNDIERSLSRAVIIKTKSLPISATTFRTALSLYIAHDGRKHKHNPTLSANKHVVQICRSSLSAAADGLADGLGERRTSPLNGIELKIARSCNKVVPKSPLPRFQQRCLSTSRRDACERISAIQAVLKGRTMVIRKGNTHQLGLFFLLEACQRNAAGWSMAVWPANAKLPLPHRRSSLDPAAQSSAQAPSSLSLHAVRALDRLRTRRRVGLRAVEVIICMITRDFSVISMTSQASLSLSLSLPLTKVSDAQYRKRFRASYNKTPGFAIVIKRSCLHFQFVVGQFYFCCCCCFEHCSCVVCNTVAVVPCTNVTMCVQWNRIAFFLTPQKCNGPENKKRKGTLCCFQRHRWWHRVTGGKGWRNMQ